MRTEGPNLMRFVFSAMRARVTHISWPKAGTSGHQIARKPSSSARIAQGYDRHQLAPMAFKAQQATGCEMITALADRGYFNGDQVLSCEGTGVAPVVPKTLTSS